MTAHDYLDLLDRSMLVAFNPIAKTIEFMEKCVISSTVDGKIHEVNEEFFQALSKMHCHKFSRCRHYIKPRRMIIYLEKQAVEERRRKLRMLVAE